MSDSEIPPLPQQMQIQAQWLLNPTVSPIPINQLLLQQGPPAGEFSKADGIYLTFGHLNPPLVVGPPSPEAFQAASAVIYPVTPVASLYLTINRLREFHEVFGKFLQQLDEQT